MLGRALEVEKKQRPPEQWEIKARIVAFNDFNIMIAGATAVVGIVYIVLRKLGYDLPWLF